MNPPTASADLISPLNKGLGPLQHDVAPGDIRALGWNLLREDLSLPSAVLYRDKLLHNQQWMRQFIDAYGVRLAPHGKTTMAPQLFDLQLQGGAWGITLATAHQVLVAHHHGVRRILMANQLIGRENMAIVSRLLSDPSFTFYCLVDSAAQIDLLAAFFSAHHQRLNVLIELGVEGGRAGVRDDSQLRSVLDAIDSHRQSIALCGIEVYEGVLDNEPAIREFLERACDVTRRLLAEGLFAQKPILSGAGSAWFDVVAEVFTAASFGDQVEIVLRPGCYLTHDVGNYRKAHQRMLQHNPVASHMTPGLEPALHIWAYVQSIPEPTRAIVSLGRRDAAFDSGLPVPALHYRPNASNRASTSKPIPAPAHWETTKLMDQHAYLRIDPADNLRVGDMIAFDICHPCLTFDKWRTIPILDADYNVVDIAQTFF
ncbi:MAG TPA: amino acid deaminase [Terracidiphilus sp.]|jgi:D-serine dehydratase|nr:amino acid deaminase [Terracidiphilus sp.]